MQNSVLETQFTVHSKALVLHVVKQELLRAPPGSVLITPGAAQGTLSNAEGHPKVRPMPIHGLAFLPQFRVQILSPVTESKVGLPTYSALKGPTWPLYVNRWFVVGQLLPPQCQEPFPF